MSHRADPDFVISLQRYGAVNIESCFNCGNCTAVCPLSSGDDNFPRRMIRYAQLGMKEKLLGSKELWLCYSCGECTSTCPRQADPGEFMSAARRYAIGRYDSLGLARMMYTSSGFNISFLLFFALALGMLIYSFHGPMSGESLRLFEFIPADAIHNGGIIAGAIVILLSCWGIINMFSSMHESANFPSAASLGRRSALLEAVREVFTQRRYRLDCETDAGSEPWFARKWFAHTSVLWGFLGLFCATALDYLLSLTGVKPTGTWVPLWYPVRLIGTIFGLAFMYGVTLIIVRRFTRADTSHKYSTPSDWSFLVLLWLSGMTGLALELAIYLPGPHGWSYWLLVVHLIAVGELMILLPFTKFAHAIYRTLAIYFFSLKPKGEAGSESAAV